MVFVAEAVDFSNNVQRYGMVEEHQLESGDSVTADSPNEV